MVFYNKYRPQSLDQLVGQAKIKEALISAIKANKLAHAYLFCGPRGTGKTSTARILAKIVNCTSDGDLPCNNCPECISITEGSNFDVIEMDAASNRGIEDIRNLRENIKLSPSSAKKKVYIIDEVHMLTGDAFNALLKTLEEPPSHVMFILATTEVQKIPPTIISRVQRMDFKPATHQEMLEALKKVVSGENIDIEEEALLAVAKNAQGSFRDGIKMLDQLSALGQINIQTVEQLLGGSTLENRLKLLDAVATKRSDQALIILNQALTEGQNPKELTIALLEILRDLIYIKYNLGGQLVEKEMDQLRFEQYCKLADKYQPVDVILTINNLQNSLEQSRYVTIPGLPLEVAIVESSQNQSVPSVVDNYQPLPQATENPTSNHQSDEPVLPKKEASLVDEIKEIKGQVVPSGSDYQKIQEKWTYILETVRQYNFSLEALLRTSKIGEVNDKNVVIEVPYSFHQRIIEAPKSRELLESVFGDILGRKMKVVTEISKKPVKKEELANVEVAADDEIIRIAAEIFNSDSIN